MTQKQPHSISDKELSQALASLREDVAAPADFRAKLMQRLQREGLLKVEVAVVPAQPSAWARLAALLTPVRVGFAATAVFALVFVFRAPQEVFVPVSSPAPTGPAEEMAGTSGQAFVHVGASKAQKEVSAKSEPAAAPVEVAFAPKTEAEPMPDALLDRNEEPAAAMGNEVASAPVTSSRASVASADSTSTMASTGAGMPLGSASAGGLSAASAKPTIVVVEPSPTPIANPLDGNSQLRGNVIRASEGGEAVLLYRVLKAGRVRAEIFDRLGRSITVLRDSDQAAGVYELHWKGHSDNGSLAPSGIMVLDLRAPGYHVQHKLMLVK